MTTPAAFSREIGADGKPLEHERRVVSNYFIGDPEWIGGLRYPEFAHAADNRFLYRYAYLAVAGRPDARPELHPQPGPNA